MTREAWVDDFFRDLERWNENTVTFVVKSATLVWSPTGRAGPASFAKVSFRVNLSGDLRNDPGVNTPVQTLRWELSLCELWQADYPTNDQGAKKLGVLSHYGDWVYGELYLPAEDLRAIGPVIVTSGQDGRARIQLRVFGGLPDWTHGKGPLVLEEFTIAVS